MARPRVHLAATTLLVVAFNRHLTWCERSVVLATGVLIDLDHLVDLALVRRVGQRRWIVLPLHGWELVGVLALEGFRVGGSRVARLAAVGLFTHLLLDLATNRVARPAFYSLLYRGWHGFRADRLRPGGGDGGWVRQPWWRWL
jgi:hypothetical protein